MYRSRRFGSMVVGKRGKLLASRPIPGKGRAHAWDRC
jgi:hypothetical protein